MKTVEILETLAAGNDLSAEMATVAFTRLMDGEMSAAQAGAFLMGLRQKGETALEMATAVSVCLDRARLVTGLSGKRMDPVGTGGDGRNSFNCSTATALTLAGMGYQVTKHGNRAVSSSCGSADAVDGMGMPMLQEPQDLRGELARRNFVFLFAPYFHPAFKHIMPVRQELGMRTLFNLLGPLLNPARPTHQLLGVARPEYMQLMADALALSGIERAAVVHGAGGYDELTPMGPAQVVMVEGRTTRSLSIDPAAYGIAPCRPEELAVSGKEQGLAVLKELLAGEGPAAMREMLVFNVGVAVHLLEDGRDMAQCMTMARDAVMAGAGGKVIHA
ncbi:anthranilate phosphoribosyltransferase [Desulfovibrio subterraneus]|uniref:anthranilate phosphoribosyltransferase n=1 Tax=Desulfovibrio subterraneus TaxID=2718620 RepID=UPI0022B8FDC7|nr:anthranilate phosphoribosyltransferase [Desulfovibrio subterraneus]WBF69153.1 anthranilate phosphoribosyltransferase [Desulfovibrio subterraneus]